MIKKLMDEVKPFIDQVYLPDVCAIAGMYADWFNYGAGVTNYMASRICRPTARTPSSTSRGYILDGNLSSVHRFDGFRDKVFTEAVTEETKHAWYKVRCRFRRGRARPIPNIPIGMRKASTPGQGAPLPGPSDAGWTSGSDPGRLRLGRCAHPQAHRQGAGPDLDRCRPQDRRGPAPVHHGPSRRPRHPRLHAGRTGRKHWQLLVNNIASGDVAIHNNPEFPAGEIEAWACMKLPRLALALDGHQGRQDRELSGGRALHLECLSA